MHVMVYLDDFDIDPSTRLPILFFRVVLDTGSKNLIGLFGVALTAYGMSSAAKQTLGKTVITQAIKDAWNITVPGTATWEVYGI